MIVSSPLSRWVARTPAIVGRRAVGAKGTKGWKLYFSAPANATFLNHVLISPWHALPLQVKEPKNCTTEPCFWYVNEIPRGTRGKYECNVGAPYNPIWQDRKAQADGSTIKLRDFTYGDIPFNYGFFPQTWENPKECDPLCGDSSLFGDGDPLDVVYIHSNEHFLSIGSVVAVRLLGALALVDEGELDWKILVTGVDHPSARLENSEYRSLETVPKERINEIVRWFREYKTTDGKPKNEFLCGGVVQTESVGLDVVEHCTAQYKNNLKRAENVWQPTDDLVEAVTLK